MNKALFIKKATEIYDNKYDYSRVLYTSKKDNVFIICPEHGEFEETPLNHLNGYECDKCVILSEKIMNTKYQLDICVYFLNLAEYIFRHSHLYRLNTPRRTSIVHSLIRSAVCSFALCIKNSNNLYLIEDKLDKYFVTEVFTHRDECFEYVGDIIRFKSPDYEFLNRLKDVAEVLSREMSLKLEHTIDSQN